MSIETRTEPTIIDAVEPVAGEHGRIVERELEAEFSGVLDPEEIRQLAAASSLALRGCFGADLRPDPRDPHRPTAGSRSDRCRHPAMTIVAVYETDEQSTARTGVAR